MISEFKHILLSGKPCMIHDDFKPCMDLFCRYLELTGCSALINSSYRPDTNVNGAIVKPATKGNHLVGCAIDCNILDKKMVLWTSAMLRVFCPELPEFNPKINNEVLTLINLVRRSHTLRWGGDFHPDRKGNTDPVHFDNAINIRSPKRWQEIYDEIHNPQQPVPPMPDVAL